MFNNVKNPPTSSPKTVKREASKKKLKNKFNSSAILPNFKRHPMRKDSKILNHQLQLNIPIIGLHLINLLLPMSILRLISKRKIRRWE
jgi:hypothetical protein